MRVVPLTPGDARIFGRRTVTGASPMNAGRDSISYGSNETCDSLANAEDNGYARLRVTCDGTKSGFWQRAVSKKSLRPWTFKVPGISRIRQGHTWSNEVVTRASQFGVDHTITEAITKLRGVERI